MTAVRPWGMRVAEARHLAEELRRKASQRAAMKPCNSNSETHPQGDLTKGV